MKTKYFGEIACAEDFVIPALPAMRDEQVYMVNTDSGPIAVMSQKTWEGFGQMVASLRAVTNNVSRKMKEQNEALDANRRMHADLIKKYNHLKETTQAARRASLESVFKPGTQKSN